MKYHVAITAMGSAADSAVRAIIDTARDGLDALGFGVTTQMTTHPEDEDADTPVTPPPVSPRSGQYL